MRTSKSFPGAINKKQGKMHLENIGKKKESESLQELKMFAF